MRPPTPHRLLLIGSLLAVGACAAEPVAPSPAPDVLADAVPLVDEVAVEEESAQPDVDTEPDAEPDAEPTPEPRPILLPVPPPIVPTEPPPEWPVYEANTEAPVHPMHTEDCSSADGLSLYLTRIEPLVDGSKPVSCNQCHLSGIDMGLYVRDTPCQTMACMIDAGEVDLDDPEGSELLARILHDADPVSPLISDAVLAEEHAGVLEWITWSSGCHAVLCPPFDDPCGGGDVAPPQAAFIAPIGGCDEDALVADFDARVFRWRGRCAHCHQTCKEDYPAPCWMDTDFDSEDPVAQRTAAMHTMYNLLGVGAIDVTDPAQSLFILKPLDEESGGVSHGGGKKMAGPHDQAYQDFVLWAEGYATCYQGDVPQLPGPHITEPLHKKKFYVGDLISFEGEAVDPQDGPLPEEALVWTSELLDAPFGTGRGPFEATLPFGDQVITLTATDSDDNVGAWTIILRIHEPAE